MAADPRSPIPDPSAEGRVLGLDVGHRRIGVAISDPTGALAQPAPPLQGRARGRALALLATRCQEENLREIVVGLPYTLHGEIGPQAQQIVKFVQALQRVVPVPVRTWDERFSTDTAREILRDQGVPPDRWRDRIDSIAAAVMLQSYLDASRGSRVPRPGSRVPSPESEDRGVGTQDGEWRRMSREPEAELVDPEVGSQRVQPATRDSRAPTWDTDSPSRGPRLGTRNSGPGTRDSELGL